MYHASTIRLGLYKSIAFPLPTRLLHSRLFLRVSSSTRPFQHPHPSLLQKQTPSTLRFFSTTLRRQNRRPYPHRQFNHHYRKSSFLGFLDDIPQNTVFWGIITINGVVFLMWFMASQRLVHFSNYTNILTSLMPYIRNNNTIQLQTDG